MPGKKKVTLKKKTCQTAWHQLNCNLTSYQSEGEKNEFDPSVSFEQPRCKTRQVALKMETGCIQNALESLLAPPPCPSIQRLSVRAFPLTACHSMSLACTLGWSSPVQILGEDLLTWTKSHYDTAPTSINTTPAAQPPSNGIVVS